MSKDIPIIFSAPMIRALIDGRKTMTRQILKGGLPPAPAMDAVNSKNVIHHAAPYFDSYRNERRSPENPHGMSRNWCWWTRDDRQCLPTINVKYQPGDRLWVRENWKPVHSGDPSRGAEYRADVGIDQTVWRPSIHLPRWASRLTLVVTAVKVERLHEIGEQDAEREGCVEDWADGLPVWYIPGAGMKRHSPSGRECFAWLWGSIHGGATGWDENPFVVAITFRVIKANIDAPEARAA